METSRSGERLTSSSDDGVWFEGADGERQAIRVDSRDTDGAYSVIESVAEPGCAVADTPSSQRGRTRPGVVGALPNCHWRLDFRCAGRNSHNRGAEHSAQLAKCRRRSEPAAGHRRPRGLEQILYAIKDTPPDEIADLAARFGCDILGPPVEG
jgi:hypothetical protein